MATFTTVPLVGATLFTNYNKNKNLSATTSDIPGSEVNYVKKGFDIGSAVLQSKKPLKKIHNHLHGFHFYSGHPKHSVPAHHFCSHVNDDFSQCLIYDSNDENARLIGVEFIISEKIYNTLPSEEKKMWHSHSHEVKSGILTAPGMPMTAEHRVMKEYLPTFGKTFHFWHADINGTFDELPYGIPQLMMAHTDKNPINRNLLLRRDVEFGINTQSLQDNRSDLSTPQKIKGADSWEDGPAYQLNIFDSKTLKDHSVEAYPYHDKKTYDHIVDSMERKGSKKDRGYSREGEGLGETLIEKTKDFGNQFYEKGREVKEEIKKDARDFGNFTKSNLEKGKEKVEDLTEKMTNKTKQAFETTKEKANEMKENLSKEVKETADEIKQRNEELKRKTNDIFEGNPDFDDLQTQAHLKTQALLEQYRNENNKQPDFREREKVFGSEMNESLSGKFQDFGNKSYEKGKEIKEGVKDFGNQFYEKGREVKEEIKKDARDFGNKSYEKGKEIKEGVKDFGNQFYEKGREVKEDIKKDARDFGNKSYEKGREIKEGAKDFGNQFYEKGREVKEDIKKDARDFGNFAKNNLEKGKEKVEDLTEKMTNKTKQTFETTKEKANEMKENLSKEVKETTDEIKQRNEELKRKTNDIFEGRPDYDDLQTQARLNNQLLLDLNNERNSATNFSKNYQQQQEAGQKGFRIRDEKDSKSRGIPQTSLQERTEQHVPHDFLESTSTLTNIFGKK